MKAFTGLVHVRATSGVPAIGTWMFGSQEAGSLARCARAMYGHAGFVAWTATGSRVTGASQVVTGTRGSLEADGTVVGRPVTGARLVRGPTTSGYQGILAPMATGSRVTGDVFLTETTPGYAVTGITVCGYQVIGVHGRFELVTDGYQGTGEAVDGHREVGVAKLVAVTTGAVDVT